MAGEGKQKAQIFGHPTLRGPHPSRPTLGPTLHGNPRTPNAHIRAPRRFKRSKPTLAKLILAKVKVLVVCKDFGFWELIVWVFLKLIV